MATKNSESSQKGELVSQHKRMAMGAQMNGKTLNGGGDSKKSSGLDSVKKK